jgi:transcriptional regulator with XRE-family HTH domain
MPSQPRWTTHRRSRRVGRLRNDVRVVLDPIGASNEHQRYVRILRVNALPIPAPVKRAIEKLGRDISLARRRRYFSQQSLAERIGSSLATVRRLEKGDPRVPLHYVARALYVFGELERLNELLDTSADVIGLMLMNEQLPKRIRTRKQAKDSGAL